MKLLKNDKKQKESNIAKTPDEFLGKKTLSKTKVFFFVWNIFTITLYSCYTLFIVYKLTEKTFLSKIIPYLLGIYVISFLLLIFINLGNHKKLKYKLKNFGSATKFLKYSVQILNFVLSIFTAINAFFISGSTDFSTIVFAVLSIFVTAILILFEIAKILIRKHMPLIKQNFYELRDKPMKNDN